MSRLSNILTAIINPFGKKLWSGTWTSGAKTVTGSTKYYAFLITLSNNYPLIAVRDIDRGRVYGIGGTSDAYCAYTAFAGFNVSGDTWTMMANSNNAYIHNANGNHGAKSAQTITGVYGLIPNWGGLKSPDFNGLCRFLVCEEVAA